MDETRVVVFACLDSRQSRKGGRQQRQVDVRAVQGLVKSGWGPNLETGGATYKTVDGSGSPAARQDGRPAKLWDVKPLEAAEGIDKWSQRLPFPSLPRTENRMLPHQDLDCTRVPNRM